MDNQKPETESKPEQSQNDVDSKITAAMAEIEKKFKTEIAGLNRRNTELEKELETEHKSKMTETERLKFEKEAAEKRAADLEAKQQEYQTDQMIMAGLAAKDINATAKSLMVKPGTAEELVAWMTTFTKTIESEVERRVNERLTSAPPKASDKKPVGKTLETFEDGKSATEAEFLEYLKTQLGA